MLSLRALWVHFVVVALLTGHSAQSAAEEQGVWVKHDMTFQFQGFTSTYSCDGLASQLKILLIAAGARGDAKVTPGACSSSFGRPDIFARAKLTFYTLTPASGADGAGASVMGVWRPVALADRSPRDLRLGDCELVEQFRDKVLPLFTTRKVVNGMTCVPHQLSGSAIKLNFESFAPASAAQKK